MKNFIFDLYGTLVDIKTDEKNIKFWKNIAKTLSTCNNVIKPKDARDTYLALCNNRAEGKDKYYEFDLLDVFKEYLANYNLSNDDKSAKVFASKFRQYSIKRLRVYPYVVDIIKRLKSHDCNVYLLSNAQVCFTLDELKKSGLDALFDGIIISSSVGMKKPSKAIFDCLIERYQLDVKNSVFIGNDLHDDILGASSVGMTSVYIKTRQSSKRKVDIKPTFVASNFAKLRDILNSLLIIDHQRLVQARLR